MIHWLTDSLAAAAAMLWETFWALALGFTISACLQVFVRRESITQHFGRAGWREVALATFLGAVSSSCSYAAAAASKTLFKKGAHLVPTLAFLFASTNLVLELGFVLWVLMGWRFVLAEVAGSLVLIGVMWLLVKATLPRGLAEEARRHATPPDEGGCCHGNGGHDHAGHDHPMHDGGKPWSRVAEAFFMDVSMMWKEILAGFLIAGFLMTVVPQDWWRALFLTDVPQPWRLIENTLVGVLVAMASFTCSVGNIPLASLLWSGGISFGGVISFIFADLVIVPLLLIYRKHYGLRFTALGLVPLGPRPPNPMENATFAWNYTTWLDLAALALLGWLAYLRFSRKSPSVPR